MRRRGAAQSSAGAKSVSGEQREDRRPQVLDEAGSGRARPGSGRAAGDRPCRPTRPADRAPAKPARRRRSRPGRRAFAARPRDARLPPEVARAPVQSQARLRHADRERQPGDDGYRAGAELAGDTADERAPARGDPARAAVRAPSRAPGRPGRAPRRRRHPRPGPRSAPRRRFRRRARNTESAAA